MRGGFVRIVERLCEYSLKSLDKRLESVYNNVW